MGLFDKLKTRLTNKSTYEEPREEAAETTAAEQTEDSAEEQNEQETVVTAAVQAEPAAAEEVKEERTAEAAPAESIEPSDELPCVSPAADIKKTLLIVDNDSKSKDILDKMLSENYDLQYAANGVEAMQILRKRRMNISLVLLNVMMNGKEGIDVLRVIKDDSALQDMPVVVFTSDRDAEAKSVGLGAMDIIPKPLPDQSVVNNRVSRCLELAEKNELIKLTERDTQTSLYNPDYFCYYVSLFDKTHHDVQMDAVMAVITNFKMISDHYGKKFADSVLKAIGDGVRNVARKTGGYGCRNSEDSFLIYCPHTDNYDRLLKEIMSGVESDTSTAGKARMCLGVYSNADKVISIEQRFEFADIAAQSAINSYTEKIGIYGTEMKEAAQLREQILSEFIPSLNSGRFKIYFQPKFDIRGDKPVLYSAEALVRWDHPQLGMLSPGAFIGLLEENGLITQLDRYVWSEAAAQIRRWKDECGYSVPVSVNISRIDMLLPLLKDIFKEILKKYSLDEDDIILEITESAADGDNDQILSAAQELRGMGMGLRIEMGNFGAGYSSIGMLSHMPIDALKIDMDFVHNSLGDNKDMSMIELIIDIADYLHVPVVAEGVETEEQYLLLKALGCDLVQGFYFSKPVPKEEFEHFIREAKSDVHIVPDTQRNYVSISKALTGEYEKIFYIDVNTDHYMQFYQGAKGEFRISTGGKNFFEDIDEQVLSFVVPEDRERIGRLLGKEELLGWMNADKPMSTHFTRIGEGSATLCTLETIHTRNQDDHHVVVGIRQKKAGANG
ncbi:MAG: EAL domain-containing protein [Oscillospiraceae bacterium]|nr:EAL domain-containing protein [Oscillospiraceae bacterium]